MSVYDESLELHKKLGGKISLNPKQEIKDAKSLSLMYTPGVAQPCIEISKNPEAVYSYTSKSNLVAVVSDGTAVLGLGNIGALAAIPVMEGKAALFKTFADVDAFPVCIDTMDDDKLVETIKLISPVFGGINLEDIAAPRCFKIEARLRNELDIPVFHDDQHGTAIVVTAALINALRLVNKKIGEIKITINGVGSAGMAILKLLVMFGARSFALCDSRGEIYDGIVGLDDVEGFEDLILRRKRDGILLGDLSSALRGSDVLIGVSAGNVVSREMVSTMNKDAIIFAMANPTPEITPDEALAGGAKIIATGRSDYPNQVNNVLAFPGIFRGALDCRASEINDEMKIAAVHAISGLITENDLNETNIIPNAFDARVVPAVAEAVIKAARKSGVAKA